MVLEHIVDLKIQQLFEYKVPSRIITDGKKELRFQDIEDETLKKQAELSVLKGDTAIFFGYETYNIPLE